MISGKQAQQIARALFRAGAQWAPVFRKERDANGMPTGKETRIGCILGMRYTKGSAATIRIDVPGTILRTDVPRFEGILAHGCPGVQKGDEICLAGTRMTVMDAQAVDGLYWILILEE